MAQSVGLRGRRARIAADALDPPSKDETLDPANETFARQAKRRLQSVEVWRID